MAQSSFGGFTAPRKDSGKSQYYPTQKIGESDVSSITPIGKILWASSSGSYPTSIDTDKYGNSYVSCSNPSGTILTKYSNLGSTLAVVSSSASRSYGSGEMVISKKLDRVYMTGYLGSPSYYQTIFVYDLNLSFQTSFGTQTSAFKKICLDKYDNIYSFSQTVLYKWDYLYQQKWTYTSSTTIKNIFVDSDGNSYIIASDQKIYVIDSNGSLNYSFSISNTNALDIAVDKNKNVFISYSASSSVSFEKYDSKGALVWSVTNSYYYIGNGNMALSFFKIALDKNENVVSSTDGKIIKLSNRDGSEMMNITHGFSN